MSSQFKPKGFVDNVTQLLSKGEDSLHRLIDAYNWAQLHLKEIHRCYPDYTQNWLCGEIARVFNVNVHAYCRTAVKFGGGKSVKALKEGYAIIRRFGVYECIRAERLLRTEDIDTLRTQITEKTTLKEFRSKVDALEQNLRELRPNGKPTPFPTVINYRKEYVRLEKEAAKLRLQLVRLEEENKALRDQLARIKELMTSCKV